MALTADGDADWPTGHVCFPVVRDVTTLLSELSESGEVDEDLAGQAAAAAVARLTALYPGIVAEAVRVVVRPGAVIPPANFDTVPPDAPVGPARLPTSAETNRPDRTRLSGKNGAPHAETALAAEGAAGSAGSGKLAEREPSPAYAESVSAFVRAVAAHLDAVAAGLEAARSGESHDRAGVRERTARSVARAGAALEEARAGLTGEPKLPVLADDPSGADARDPDPLARDALLDDAAALLGPAAEAWGADEGARELRARQHAAVERVMDLLAAGDYEGAREMADEIGPDHGFPGRGLGGAGLQIWGENYSTRLHLYPEHNQPVILADMVRTFRERVLGKASAMSRLSPEETSEFLREWSAIERKLRKIIAVDPGSRGEHPLVPSGPVGTHPDFGSKAADIFVRDNEQLARYLLGWVKAKPRRRGEKQIAREVHDSQDVNLLIASVLHRAADKIDAIDRDRPDVIRELKTGTVGGQLWKFGYAKYFHPSNLTLAGRGLQHLLSEVWADRNPDRFYGVVHHPEAFSFRDKIMVLHDLAEYFGGKRETAGSGMVPAWPDKLENVTTQVDERGFRTADEPPASARALHERKGEAYVELNENDPWTSLARRNGIPVWNGPSGTTARIAAFTTWVGASLHELSAVVWGITAFWRLYYDHALSSTHTVHEVMDIASNFGLPYSVHNPYGTLGGYADIGAAVSAARAADVDFRLALDLAGGPESLAGPLAEDARSLLQQAGALDVEPWISGFTSFTATSRAHIEAVRTLTDTAATLKRMALSLHEPRADPGQEAEGGAGSFNLELTASVDSGKRQVTIRVGPLEEAAPQAAVALAGQISAAFRGLYGGASPTAGTNLEVQLPQDLGGQAHPVVMSAASTAAGQLGHAVTVYLSPAGPVIKLCPP